MLLMFKAYEDKLKRKLAEKASCLNKTEELEALIYDINEAEKLTTDIINNYLGVE